ncbi:MAG TPA: hypothetical protein VK711_11875 [Puia sp.]|nr:hypothetical protein [Puia sp.]
MKVHFFKTAFVLTAIPFIFQACNKSSPSSLTPPAKPVWQNVGHISFDLKTTDMQGNTKSDFSVGENFIPTLKISNTSSQPDTLCTCLLINYDQNLLGVYTNNSEKYGDSAIFIGKPWNGVGNYFNLHHTVIPANSAYVYAIPWISDTTKSYDVGELIFDPSPQPPYLQANILLSLHLRITIRRSILGIISRFNKRLDCLFRA